MKLRHSINSIQRRYNELCDVGGGPGRGPHLRDVQSLIKAGSEKLNDLGQEEIGNALAAFPERDPWKICFAVGLCWGHLARYDLDFVDAATRCMDSLNDTDIRTAASFHLERGELPIRQSLQGAYAMFQKTRLPNALPDSVATFKQAQQRVLAIVLIPGQRPKYIGAWNATALFLTAVFNRRSLWTELRGIDILLPPNGPVSVALDALYKARLVSRSPYSSDLDDAGWEPGVLTENNALMAELVGGPQDLNMVDVHSGLYMLGTGYKSSPQWEPEVMPV